MQRHAFESGALDIPVQREIAVFFVAEDREPEMRQMDPNLMRAPGLQLGLEQTHFRPARQQAKDRVRHLAFGIHRDPPLAAFR